MGAASGKTSASALRAGWEALGERRWDAARALFSQALEEQDAPEAREGLSWAAWWVDDAELVFDSRERAYRAYRRRGDAASAARMATWLATDQLDFRGGMAVAQGWLARAGRLLAAVEPGPEHGWLAFTEGFVAHWAGDTVATTERARRAADVGRRFDVPDLEMLGLALEGASLVACAQVEQGMGCLDEATAIALEDDAQLPISNAWTFCFLVSACTAVLDYERAFAWCDRIAEFAERHGSRYMLAFCKGDYGLVHLWRGQWTEADGLLRDSIEDYSRSRPALAGGSLAALAELRRRQGELDDAERLVQQAGTSTGAQLCRARMLLDRGEARDAADLLERLLRHLPEHRGLDRVPVLDLLARARIGQGELDAAAAAVRELREVEGLVATQSLRACVDLVEGELAAAAGDRERARRLLEDAVGRFEDGGAPFEAATARTHLALVLATMGRAGAAAREASSALRTLVELGARPAAERARAVLQSTSDVECPPADAEGAPAAAAVTRREQEVLCLLAEGLTNRQIAERLVVSEHTVHRHVTNILRKLDLPTRAAAAAHAVRAGLVSPPRA